jgi:tripartite-type tricarboxylate transporter receptor subunit TctC
LGNCRLVKRAAVRHTFGKTLPGGKPMPRLLVLLLAAIGWFAPAAFALAQDWPARPVKIIIPLGPGGGGDVFTRLMAEELQKRLGQPFIVENRPGGGLNIGTRACAEAPPDGTTFCVLSGEPIVYNQFTFKSLPYNPEKDFEPVVNLFINANALVVNSKLNVKTIPELIALAKSKPGTLSYGTFSFMLAYFMDQLNKKNGIDIVRVPFRSGNEMVNAVMTGTAPIVFLGLSNMIGQVKSGQFTGLALNSNARLPLFPDIPTLKEATGEDYPPPWFALFAPAGTPLPIVDKLHDEVVRIAAVPEWRQRNFVERAVEPATGPRDEFIKFIADNRAFAARIAKEAGIKPQQ